ncbi:coiled-coil domain-containing protein, partial [Clarias magur]
IPFRLWRKLLTSMTTNSVSLPRLWCCAFERSRARMCKTEQQLARIGHNPPGTNYVTTPITVPAEFLLEMRLRTRKTSTVLRQPVSREQEEEEEEMRAKSKNTRQDLSLHQSTQDMPQKSRVEKIEKGLFVVQSPQNQQKIPSRTKSSEKVLSPLRDHPQTSAAAKANET